MPAINVAGSDNGLDWHKSRISAGTWSSSFSAASITESVPNGSVAETPAVPSDELLPVSSCTLSGSSGSTSESTIATEDWPSRDLTGTGISRVSKKFTVGEWVPGSVEGLKISRERCSWASFPAWPGSTARKIT